MVDVRRTDRRKSQLHGRDLKASGTGVGKPRGVEASRARRDGSRAFKLNENDDRARATCGQGFLNDTQPRWWASGTSRRAASATSADYCDFSVVLAV